jgi:tetratricopeptide (TPR) repeat protein
VTGEPPASGAPGKRRPPFLALLVAAALAGILGFWLYRILTPRGPAGLRLADDVAFTLPPDPPGSDREIIRERLAAVGPLREAGADNASRLGYAQAALRSGDALKALLALEAAYRAAPDDPNVLAGLARCRLELALYGPALQAYRERLRAAPGDLDALVRLAGLQDTLKQHEAATATLQSALRSLPPGEVQARLGLIQVAEQRRDIGGALKEAQALHAAVPGDPRAAAAVGRLLFASQRMEEARKVLEDAVKAAPSDPEAAYYLALVLASPVAERRDPARAEALLLRNARKEPADLRSLQRLGELYQEQGRVRPAAWAFSRLLTQAPASAAPRLQLARALARLGRTEAEAQERMAQRLLEQERAQRRLSSRCEWHPENPDLWLALAARYERDGRYGQALRCVQSAYCVSRGSARTVAALAGLYRRLGLPAPDLEVPG